MTSMEPIGLEGGEHNLCRLILFLVDIAPDVIREYFLTNILKQGESFEQYLLRQKHILFHLYETMNCCLCRTTNKDRRKILTNEQFKIMFQYINERFHHSHTQRSGKRLTQTCICHIEPKPNIKILILDVTLANTILKNCEQKTDDKGEKFWFESILNIRNKVFHLTDSKSVSLLEYEDFWFKLTCAARGLSRLVNEKFVKATEERINRLNKISVIHFSDVQDQEEKLCREYWREKCSQFETKHREELSKYESLLENITQQKLKLHENCEDVLSKIVALGSMVESIIINVSGNETVCSIMEGCSLVEDTDNKTVPVFLQIDVPPSWNQTKIIDFIEEMYHAAVLDTPIKIRSFSTVNPEILVDVWQSVIKTATKLQHEIQSIITQMVTFLNIQRREKSEVNVSVLVHKDDVRHVPRRTTDKSALAEEKIVSSLNADFSISETEGSKTSKKNVKYFSVKKAPSGIESGKKTITEPPPTETVEILSDNHDHSENLDESKKSLEELTTSFKLNTEEVQPSVQSNPEVSYLAPQEKTVYQKERTIIEGPPPTFTQHLETISGKIHRPQQFKCKINDAKSVNWIFNDQTISCHDEEYKMRNLSDGTSVLEIKTPTYKHVGTYICKASNLFGTSETKAYFSILGEEERTENPRRDPNPSSDSIGQALFHLLKQSTLDQECVDVTCGIFVGGKRFFLVDRTRKLLIVYFTDLSNPDFGRILNTFDLHLEPYSVTLMKDSMVAVTFPNNNKLEILDLMSENNFLRQKVDVPLGCHSVTCLHNTLVVVSQKGLLFINNSKTEEQRETKNVKTHENDRVIAHGDSIYYTNYRQRYLASYNISGKQLFTLSTLPFKESPLDMAMIEDNILYVLCEKGTVVHVTLDKSLRHRNVEMGFESLSDHKIIMYDRERLQLYIMDEKSSVYLFEKISDN